MVGSKAIFRRVEELFASDQLDTFFIKEQINLYKWRKDFFTAHFPEDTWTTKCNFWCDSAGTEDFHYQAAVHYNITSNFDTVVDRAFMSPRPDKFFFPTDYFPLCFHNKYDFSGDDEDILAKLTTVDFSQAVHVVSALWSCGPPTMREVAIRSRDEYTGNKSPQNNPSI